MGFLHQPERLYDLLPVVHSAVIILHKHTHPHGLVHHVQHVDVGVVEHGAHFVHAVLAHLQQLCRGCSRVKETQNAHTASIISFGPSVVSSVIYKKQKDIFLLFSPSEVFDGIPGIAKHFPDLLRARFLTIHLSQLQFGFVL